MRRGSLAAAAVAVAVAAVVTGTAAPAAAWTNGAFQAWADTNSLKVKINGNLVNVCGASRLAGTMTAAGAFTVTAADASGCSTPVNLAAVPWSGQFTPTRSGPPSPTPGGR